MQRLEWKGKSENEPVQRCDLEQKNWLDWRTQGKIVSKSGAVYIGYGAFPCVGEDENDEEVDAILFEFDNGGGVTLTENDIDHYEILD